jgi:uncharacterized protein YcfL
MYNGNMKKIMMFFVIVLVLTSCRSNEPIDLSDYESICIMKESSAKETVIMDAVWHDGRVFPLEGSKRDGCLLLHDQYMFDLDGDGVRDKGRVFGEFVEDSRDHCCTLGY